MRNGLVVWWNFYEHQVVVVIGISKDRDDELQFSR